MQNAQTYLFRLNPDLTCGKFLGWSSRRDAAGHKEILEGFPVNIADYHATSNEHTMTLGVSAVGESPRCATAHICK
jgi:hypothetical protein